jgi:hypothetical protein
MPGIKIGNSDASAAGGSESVPLILTCDLLAGLFSNGRVDMQILDNDYGYEVV